MDVLALALLGWIGAAVVLDRSATAEPRSRDYDAIVVAGAGVRPDGTPSGTLVRRTRRGSELVLDGVAPTLALTGGVGDWGRAESLVAAELAVDFGVGAESIVLEALSTSTEGNAREMGKVLGRAKVLVVTDRFHAFRCRRVFGRYFDEVDVVGVTGPPLPRAYGALREVLAVAWYAVNGRLG